MFIDIVLPMKEHDSRREDAGDEGRNNEVEATILKTYTGKGWRKLCDLAYS